MNETQKTGIFAAIAAIAVLLAFLTSPVSITKEDEKGELAAGELLFKDDASDVSKAASLKITKFDENKLAMESFEIVRDKDTGLWKIPSEYSYPADAEEQLKNATSPLAGMKILSVIEDAGRGDHPLYGVVEPSDKLEAGVTGVGMLISVTDASGKSMASLIVGKKLADTQDNLHYVRIPNQDPVYTVEIDTSVFNTDFKKWIKPDLLTVKSVDIDGIGIRDYRTEQRATNKGVSVGMERTMEADFNYDTASNKWNLQRLVAFDGATPKPDEVAEGDEIKSDKLNSIRTAAQSLQIVGVRPKPKGLAADLKADKNLLENEESMVSLLDQGFVPHEVNGSTDILATAGETILTTRDGVKYTLRFGEERVVNAALEAGADDKADAATSKRERYLLVTASVDESRFPAPELQPIPNTIEDLRKMDAEKAAAEAAKKAAAAPAPAATTPAEPPAAAPDKPADAKSEETKTEDAKPVEPAPPADAKPAEGQPEPAATEPKVEEPKTEEPKVEEPKTEEPTPEAEQPKADEPKSASACGDESESEDSSNSSDNEETDEQDAAAQPPAEKPAEKPAEPATPPAPVAATDAAAAGQLPEASKPAEPAKPMTDEELKDRLPVVQSDITKANERLIDARNEKLAAARKKVQALNARFADWYYLIDDSSFKQLMLKRDVLIGPKAPATTPATPAPPSIPGLNFPQQ